jgi:ubiquinone/menaquinone biosynthesis C-methylase UbiE
VKSDLKDAVREYWEKHPNAAAIAAQASPQTRRFYEDVEAHRYAAEPCIREMAEFDRWKGRTVLEIGCGMGTDLRQFASAGAAVVGIDLTWQGIRMAKTAFQLFGLRGAFVVADAEMLPFREESFDLVYSNGVIHHTPDTPATVREIHRVARSGGEARVMIYHRNSYFARVIVGLIIAPAVRTLLTLFPSGRLPSFLDRWVPGGIKNLYLISKERGFSRELIFSLSTDPSQPGPGNANPLARAYTVREATRLFSSFRSTETFIRQLYYADFLPAFLQRWLERRFGWFLFIRASK